MTFKGVAAVAVALLAVCLMARGEAASTPAHHPAIHVTLTPHHSATPHAAAKPKQ
ncbi:hypothetical protein [Streptacidiphilus carbonis]|uniref:hypothetical protein n=1 Tax=Streptacidiphilus carbonis TaxID=105422 RepID=UPI00137697EB|nr:hypothetical protein [Streptacidiphilus carbonis]